MAGGKRMAVPGLPSRGDRLFSDVAGLGRNVSGRAGPAPSRGRRLKLRYREVAKNDVRLKRRTADIEPADLIGRRLVRQDGGRGTCHLTCEPTRPRRSAQTDLGPAAGSLPAPATLSYREG
jgi:hypothetical protein